MRLPAVLLLSACATGDGAEKPAPAEDTGGTEDSAPGPVDTGFTLVYFEGSADLSAGTWNGEEAWVATTMNGAEEHCRVVNALTGTPSAVELCPGCTFAFDVTVGPGALAGDACANVGFTADMWEGASWIYAFAPSYVYGAYGYTYTNVLLYGYDAGDGIRWTMTADAEPDGADAIDYEALYADLWTYTSP